jgi:integrase
VRTKKATLTLRTDKGTTRVRNIAVTHRHAVAVLSRRWDAADEDAQLFPEFKPGGYDKKLSWAVSKAFGRFRDAVGLPRGVDFHSFRRTLITLLENSGADQVMIARYVGHALPTLAFTLYSGGSTEQTMRATARLVKYPGKVERAVNAFLGA